MSYVITSEPNSSTVAERAITGSVRSLMGTSVALSPRQLRNRHWEMLVIALIVIVLAFSMRIVHGDRVAFRMLPSSPLPQLCMARAMFGMDCPGCGLTRSFILLSQGRWHAAYVTHPLGWLLALLIVLQVPYRLAALAGVFVLPRGTTRIISACLIILLVEVWVLRSV
jgi:hypothetical protein